jgi:ribonuclease HI
MTKSITESGPQSIYLRTDSAYNIKALNGFIYVPENQTKQPNILLHKIDLTRYHMPEPTDSLSTDSVSATQEIKKESPKKQPSIRKEKPRKAARMEKIEKQ